MPEETFLHAKHDEMYIDDKHRRCPRCDDVKSLIHFRPRHRDTPGGRKYRDPPMIVTWLCQACRGKEVALIIEKNKTAVDQTKADAVMKIAKVLSKASRRTLLEDAAPTPSGALKTLVKAAGGEEAVWSAIGEVTKQMIENGDPNQQLTAIRSMMNFTVQTAKVAGPPVDLSSLSDDDLFMLLMEPAKQLLLTDADFRRELLNDPDIHRQIMEDAGVELIEA